MLKKKEFNEKKKEKKGFPSESEPQGEPVGASHHRVGARRVLAVVDAHCLNGDQKVGAMRYHGCCRIEAQESSRRPFP